MAEDFGEPALMVVEQLLALVVHGADIHYDIARS